jgi:hypothetical protein
MECLRKTWQDDSNVAWFYWGALNAWCFLLVAGIVVCVEASSQGGLGPLALFGFCFFLPLFVFISHLMLLVFRRYAKVRDRMDDASAQQPQTLVDDD